MEGIPKEILARRVTNCLRHQNGAISVQNLRKVNESKEKQIPDNVGWMLSIRGYIGPAKISCQKGGHVDDGNHGSSCQRMEVTEADLSKPWVLSKQDR